MKIASRNIYISGLFIVYVIIAILSLSNCYFWDNIQQTSIEAHWFYLNNFHTFFIPKYGLSGSELTGTGYHPPLMGIMTAVLWKILGHKLWVSHVFVLFWAVLFFFHLWRLLKNFFAPEFIYWIFAVLLLESTVLTQFFIASPDFILLTAFVISLRGILENKKLLIYIGIFFLCFINARGIFAGIVLFIAHQYLIFLDSNKKIIFSNHLKSIFPYLPTFILLLIYYLSYFSSMGWFFDVSDKTGHYSLPQNFLRIIKHIAEFLLRSLENGRFVIWFLAFWMVTVLLKKKNHFDNQIKVLTFIFLTLLSIYIIFIFITQMAFSERYFMPYFLLLTILTSYFLVNHLQRGKVKIVFVIMLIFEITGNLWIYPEPIAKSWDCTLGHASYYKLRKECFNYIDEKKIPYNELSAGFCLYGNREIIELGRKQEKIKSSFDGKYFIYSNISNLPDDEIEEFMQSGKWENIKEFKQGFVEIIIFEKK